MEHCAFLYAFVTDAPISFPHIFIRSLIEVHRSSSIAHTLFFPVFIHWILLHLGLVEFSASELVHIITPIGATFLRQMAAQLRVSSKRPRVETSGVAPPPPPPPPFSRGDTTTEEPVDPAADAVAADVPPPSTLDDSDIQRMLETVMTIQATHGQILVDMLDELHALQTDLEHLRRLPPPPPFDDV